MHMLSLADFFMSFKIRKPSTYRSFHATELEMLEESRPCGKLWFHHVPVGVNPSNRPRLYVLIY